jgi:oligoendopeptidase F
MLHEYIDEKERRMYMSEYQNWDKELDRLEAGESQYSWDELEELITDRLEDDKIDEQEFETLMRRLMDIDCEL